MSDRVSSDPLTRRQVLFGAGFAGAFALAGGGVAQGRAHRRKPLPRIDSFAVEPAGTVNAFHSRPDLRPPTVTVTAQRTLETTGRGDPPFLFLGPGPVSLSPSEQYGPLIVNREGMPVWFRPVPAGLEVTNFFPSSYQGEPVLVWWQGKVLQSGYGQGEAVLLDATYREIARVQAANGRSMDLHALTLTPQGTALFTCYPQAVPMNLSSIGAPRDSEVLEPIIQEVDIATGSLEFEWQGLQYIPVSASEEPHAEPYDYLHINSIQQLPDGNLLVSGRHTWAIYKLDRSTGEVIWTLGGKRNDFRMGPGTRFSWQHDAGRVSPQVLTVFDNGTNGPVVSEPHARGLVLEIDEPGRTVTLRHAYTPPRRLLPSSMGSVQILPSGRVLVGWGVDSEVSEFAPDGTLLFDAALPEGTYSYRSLSFPWRGTPYHQPAVAAGRDRQTGTPIVYASWNGATGIAGWRVDAGSRQDRLRPLGIASHQGFETSIPLDHHFGFVSVTALDHLGRALGASPVVRL
jgi:hypothetical protein